MGPPPSHAELGSIGSIVREGGCQTGPPSIDPPFPRFHYDSRSSMGPPTKDSAEDSASLDEQQTLLEESLELVVSVYNEASAEGVSEPVVLLLDCEDTIGSQIARSWLGSAAVDEAIADQRADDPSGESTTVFARAFPLDECARQVPAVFPYLAPIFEQALPADGFLAISVASGGASALTVPWDAVDDSPTPER
jgi:hypothetical protein